MFARVQTSTIFGMDAQMVTVEAQAQQVNSEEKTSLFNIIGLGDSAVKEARGRVGAALAQSGFHVPNRILVNLSPAEIKKEGSSFDLSIAISILRASRQLRAEVHADVCFLGELALDGRLLPVRGALAHVLAAKSKGMREIILPATNMAEAKLISGVQCIGVHHLLEVVHYLHSGESPEISYELQADCVERTQPKAFLSEVRGQEEAKRALCIAAAGGHHVLFVGPPGCGKSMLAERFVGLLPALQQEEVQEVVRIHSIGGMPIKGLLGGQRPFRSPHHLISDAGLIGGGSNPRPGEISLAHRGVLFLDEFPEFRRSALEALRLPLEAGRVSISRAKANLEFPAGFQLIVAMNPCPCGRLGTIGQECRCPRPAIARYLAKISGPILDRIDLQVQLEAVSIQEITRQSARNTSQSQDEDLRVLITQAQDRALQRQGKLNARLSHQELLESGLVQSQAIDLLEKVAKKKSLSVRACVRLLRCARTIADMEGGESVTERNVAEAARFRSLEHLESYAQGLSLGQAHSATY